MRRTEAITISNGDDSRIWLKSPYNQDLVARLKARISAPEREWSPPYWKVASQHLEALRNLAQQFATQEGWHLFDHTAHSAEEIALQKQAVLEDYLEQHVAAVLAVLPKLPRRALALVAWEENQLTLELRTYLGEALFHELRAASLDAYRPTVLYGGPHKREFTPTFILASDERLIRQLSLLAGSTRPGWSSSGVENLVVRSLPLAETFNGKRIAHFIAEDGAIWVGECYQDTDVASWNWSHRPWEIAVTEDKIYLVFEREKLLSEFLSEPGWSYFAPASGFAVAPPERPSQVAWVVRHLHLEEWFKKWAATLVASDQLQANRWGTKQHWYTSDWDHPADTLLTHLARTTRTNIPELYTLLGWTEEFVVASNKRIGHLKAQAVERCIADMRSHAATLARPLLEQKTVVDLLQLGESHGMSLKKSARKADLVAQLTANQQLAEDLIGLTQRLAPEKQLGGEQHGQ